MQKQSISVVTQNAATLFFCRMVSVYAAITILCLKQPGGGENFTATLQRRVNSKRSQRKALMPFSGKIYKKALVPYTTIEKKKKKIKK